MSFTQIDELFGDFEDLETGESFAGKRKREESESESSEDDDDDDKKTKEGGLLITLLFSTLQPDRYTE